MVAQYLLRTMTTPAGADDLRRFAFFAGFSGDELAALASAVSTATFLED